MTNERKSQLPQWFLEKDYPEIEYSLIWLVEIEKRLLVKKTLRALAEVEKLKNKYPAFEDAVKYTMLAGKTLLEGIISAPIAKDVSESGILYSAEKDLLVSLFPFHLIRISRSVSSPAASDILHLSAGLSDISIDRAKELRKMLIEHSDIERSFSGSDHVDVQKFNELSDKISHSFAHEDSEVAFDDDTFLENISFNTGFLNELPFQSDFISKDVCMVDITQDNTTLQEEFMAWVKLQRESKGIQVRDAKSKLTNEKLSAWNRYCPLQIFDIDAWCKFTGNSITDHTLASHLWPANSINAEDIDPVSRLRQSSRKKKIPDIISPDMKKRLIGSIASHFANIK